RGERSRALPLRGHAPGSAAALAALAGLRGTAGDALAREVEDAREFAGPAMNGPRDEHRALLLRVARRAMQERGLEPDFPPPALAEAQAIPGPASGAGDSAKD